LLERKRLDGNGGTAWLAICLRKECGRVTTTATLNGH